MTDCKSCGMNYDHTEYKACPYCGEEPGQTVVAEQADHNAKSKADLGGPEGKEQIGVQSAKPGSSKFKFLLIALVALVALTLAALFFFFNADSGITVPDRYATIQEAIDAAEDGDEIIVQIGVYRENIDFKGKNITLRSTDPDDPDIVGETIIDGGGGGTVVSFRSGEGEGTVLSGFTVIRGSGILISGGSSPLIEKCYIEDNSAEYGAGIAIFDSAPQIIGNTIIGNSGFLGGGIFIEESTPHIEGNTITSNRAEMGSGVVVISNSAPVIVNNMITDNIAARLGGGIVIAVNSNPTIRENIITGNSAERNGGGMLIEESEPLIEANQIAGNTAANGGGIFIVNSLTSALRIVNNEISENRAYIAGGGLYMEGSSPTLEENRFVGNISDHLGGAAAVYNSAPIFRRNTFDSNQANDLAGGGALWVSADSTLELSEPDDNTYLLNIPDDRFNE